MVSGPAWAQAIWLAPQYENQTEALGWSPDAFKTPEGMELRVQFWKDIYTKYSSSQGVLHDSLYVHLVYGDIDFSDIESNAELTVHQRLKAREKRVKEKKNETEARLKRLQSLETSEGLEGEDLRLWNMFVSITDKNKFLEASKRGRLRFQLGQRNMFLSGIQQSGRYLRQMEEIFREEGLPIELTRLPFVESSFNLRARSRVGASGIWQFMRSTAKAYMRMDASGDSRNDPLLATRAAARKLRSNFQVLGKWPLAVTAYNHGPSGVKRLTEKMGTTDIVELIEVRKGRFGFASASFFASFLAAIEVERHADMYFGAPIAVEPEIRGTEIRLTKNMPLKDIQPLFRGDLDLAKLLNPHISTRVWEGKQALTVRHTLRVPLAPETSEATAAGEPLK